MSDHFSLIEHIAEHIQWSEKTFGPGANPERVIRHIRKELAEIEQHPEDLEEWIDVIILAIDGAWRAGYEPHQIVEMLCAKAAVNRARRWPDWRQANPAEPIEHERDHAE